MEKNGRKSKYVMKYFSFLENGLITPVITVYIFPIWIDSHSSKMKFSSPNHYFGKVVQMLNTFWSLYMWKSQ